MDGVESLFEVNRQADYLSHSMIDHSEWRLHPRLFREIAQRFSQLSVDLFASPASAQFPRFFSRFPSQVGGSRCSQQPLALGTTICLPIVSPDSGCHQKTVTGTSGADICGPTLSEATMVCSSREPSRSSSVEDSSKSDSPVTRDHTTSRPAVAGASRLASERQFLTWGSYPSRVISMIQASWPATDRIYDATWRNFCHWCDQNSLSISSVTIPRILEYLLEGVDKGLAPSTIRSQVAALSTVFTCVNSTPLSQHPRVRFFIKGVTNSKPPVVHRYPTWKLPRVLQALTGSPFEPIRSCNLRHWSHKVAVLIAVTLVRRVSELAALSVREDLCTFHQDRVVLRLDPSFIPKVNTLFHRAQEIVLPDFCPNPSHDLEWQWHSLDVRRALRYYIKRTATFHRSEALFVSFHPASRGQKVSSSTIARWIKACIAEFVPGMLLASSKPSDSTFHTQCLCISCVAYSSFYR
ncbi:uncharacterized protein LOC120304105 [Crotalus tigris]|uniref:uncharacterized protein LOC120304105 n=1 Tax=Crotalus tigris TaxID=88082 RepID=UPI00192F9291|nr:uncharacterized protein LOC120304105 [Crotalus tigris]